VNDTCIVANTNLSLTVTATDNEGGIQSFTATGGPFTTTPAATFTSDAPIANPPSTGVFSWTPSCEQVRLQPYLVTFRAEDDGAPDQPAIPLTDYETFFITVIAPPVKNLAATPECTTMKLSWDAELCNPSLNPLYKYRIYRKVGCDTNQHKNCETGMPSSWGYSLIATVSNAATSYTDTYNLIHGLMYSYRVVALFVDGSESYVSDPLCATLVRDVPIITNVDVTSTGTGGSINVKWVMPLADPANYDTTLNVNHGPYRLELIRGTGITVPTFTVQTFSSQYFTTLNTTSYSDSPLNTQGTPYTYRIDFYDTMNVACPTQKASSVFLSCNPNDNRIQLSWQPSVPWTNYQYDIYKFNGATWDSIGTTASLTFTDTGLVNGRQYCYKVKSIGAYPDPSLPAPLINWSQELCCTPVDLTPPCPLTLNVDSSCVLVQNILTWNNPNNSCCDDALYYIIYYMEFEGGDFSVLDTVGNINITTYTHDSISSIAGCYAVTAVDSFGNQSAFSNVICVDNCPYYELPNVFTPNGDGSNDLFTPLHPYKFVKDIDIKIYNRWGYEVFRTTDPEIGWDGKSAQTKMMCSDGVYYYVCLVNDIRLKGIVPRVLKGNIHLLSK
jgi:gliding motility-associated-like protein